MLLLIALSCFISLLTATPCTGKTRRCLNGTHFTSCNGDLDGPIQDCNAPRAGVTEALICCPDSTMKDVYCVRTKECNAAPPMPPPAEIMCQGGGKILDTDVQRILGIWKVLPDAEILASEPGGPVLISHSMGGPLLKINGLIARSPLANYALFSFECAERADFTDDSSDSQDDSKSSSDSDKTILNLYEVMMPDIPGEAGEESTAEFYVRRLWELGLHVSGVHFHWWGSTVFSNDRLVAAIHHQSTKFSAEEFSRRTIQALHEAMDALERRAKPYPRDDSGEEYTMGQMGDQDMSQQGGDQSMYPQGGSDTGDQSGSDTGDQSGSDTGDQSGSDTGDQSGSDTGDQSGSDTGDQSQTDTDNQQQ